MLFCFCVEILPSGLIIKKENGFSFWTLKSISGLLSLEGNYRNGTSYLPGYFDDESESIFMTGKLDLNTRSVFWHPNFFQLNANFSFSPVRNLDQYIVSPDNSEINTTERIDLNGIFFTERIISLNPYFNFNHTFSRREYTTNVESFYQNYGARLFSPNNILPFNINVFQNSWNQDEIQTSRKFSTEQFAVNTELNKSFGDFNNNRINFDYFNFSRTYADATEIKNKSINWNIANNFMFDAKKNFNLNSFFSFTNQTGSQPVNRVLLNENVRSGIAAGFSTSVRYQYYKLKQELTKSELHDVEAGIQHQLFESLHSYISYNHINLSQTFYNEQVNRGEAGISYKKKIPKGMFRLNYNISLSKLNRENISGTLNIIDEPKLLSEGTVTLLANPYVELSSVEVKNADGTIIYQEYFDYLLIQRGSFTEIQRIPGGQISSGETVFVSYQAEQQPSQSYNTTSQSYGAGVTLYGNLIDLYINGALQNYSNVFEGDAAFLKTTDRMLYGMKISLDYFDLGAEYENYESNITPYSSTRIFLRAYSRAGVNLYGSFSSSYRIYNLKDDFTTQKFADVSLTLSYLTGSNSRLFFQGNYIFQEGQQIDLKLRRFSIEYIINIRQIEISAGYENYNRKLLSDETTYSGIYLKAARRF